MDGGDGVDTSSRLSLSPEEVTRLQSLKCPCNSHEHESSRLNILRETDILGSDQSETNYDRYTTLAARLFNTPYAFVTLIDLDLQYIKSAVGVETLVYVPREESFCTYVVLEDAPDVFVVEDAHKDSRFCNLPLVRGGPHFRFYAGTCIVIDGAKVGAFCVLDRVARTFSMEERMNLLDLGAAVAELMVERRKTNLQMRVERTGIIFSMMNGLESPINELIHSAGLTRDSLEELGSLPPLTAGTTSTMTKKILDTEDAVNNIICASTQIKAMIKACVSIANNMLMATRSSDPHSGVSRKDIIRSRGRSCNLYHTLEEAKRVIEYISHTSKVVWDIKVPDMEMITYSDIIRFLLIYSIGDLLLIFKNIRVNVTVQEGVQDRGNCPELVISIFSTEYISDPAKPISHEVEDGVSHLIGSAELYCSLNRIIADFQGSWSHGDIPDGKVITILLPFIQGSRTTVEPRETIKIEEITKFVTETANIDPKIFAPDTIMHSVRESATEIGADTEPLHVLIVEDTLSIQKIMKRWFMNHGCQVTLASNGKIGLEYLKNDCFDMTFMDFLMPVQLGLKTIELFNELVQTGRLPSGNTNKDMLMIGMSATASMNEQNEGFQGGMHFFCPKPVNMDTVIVMMDACRKFRHNLNEIVSYVDYKCHEAQESDSYEPIEDGSKSICFSMTKTGHSGPWAYFRSQRDVNIIINNNNAT